MHYVRRYLRWDSFLKAHIYWTWSISVIKNIYDAKFFWPTVTMELNKLKSRSWFNDIFHLYLFSNKIGCTLLNCACSIASSFVWDSALAKIKYVDEYIFCFYTFLLNCFFDLSIRTNERSSQAIKSFWAHILPSGGGSID